MENFKPMFLNKLYGTNKAGQILTLFKRDIEKVKAYTDIILLMKKYMPFIYLGNSHSTINNRFIDVKNAIKASKIVDKYKNKLLEAFTPSVDFYRVRSEIREQQLLEKIDNNEKKELNFNLADFDKIISELYKLGFDKDLEKYPYKIGSRQTKEQIRAYYLAAYLALTTGRRLTEILKTMELRKYKDTIKIKGLLKKKNEEENESYNLIVLDDNQKVLNAYKELRKIFEVGDLTERQVNQKFNARFNTFLQTKIFPNSDLSFHDLRKIYLLKAYEKFGNNEDFDEFASKILIHDIKLDAKFITQTSHYTNIKTTDNKNEDD